MYSIKDGLRTIQFEGSLLGESSSHHAGSYRWIEFALYRTVGGTYVLSRVGRSLVFHAPSCPLASKYGLHEVAVDELRVNATPCPECVPDFSVPVVFPETDRTWALVSEDAADIVDALYKWDGNTKYLTKVAERLLKQASDNDPDINMNWRVEVIF